jgi:hypothetical protein
MTKGRKIKVKTKPVNLLRRTKTRENTPKINNPAAKA